MPNIIKHAPAKVNLMLHITGIRDKYHEMQSIFTFCHDLYDVIEFHHSREFNIHSANINGISSNDNLIHRARDFLIELLGKIYIPDVQITKNIPEGSGLGGGSSDAATFLMYVLQINSISQDEIINIANKAHVLGMDITVFLYRIIKNQEYVLLDGIGKFNELSNINTKDEFNIMIYTTKHQEKLSTKLVFGVFDIVPIFEKPYDFNEEFTLQLLREQKNSLQLSAISLSKNIQSDLIKIINDGAYIARMSGSGRTCFGIYQSNPNIFVPNIIV